MGHSSSDNLCAWLLDPLNRTPDATLETLTALVRANRGPVTPEAIQPLLDYAARRIRTAHDNPREDLDPPKEFMTELDRFLEVITGAGNIRGDTLRRLLEQRRALEPLRTEASRVAP